LFRFFYSKVHTCKEALGKYNKLLPHLIFFATETSLQRDSDTVSLEIVMSQSHVWKNKPLAGKEPPQLKKTGAEKKKEVTDRRNTYTTTKTFKKWKQ
jgi:hypothetical protein